MAGARRTQRFDPQRDSFENANTAIYFGSYSTHAPRSLGKTEQVDRSSRNYDNQKASPFKEPFYHNSPSPQFEAYIPGSLSRTARVPEASLSIVPFGLTTSLQNFGVWLQESLQELAECPTYAQEEEMDEPSDLALTKARDLLEKVANYVVDRPEIYPMQQSSIAIDFRDRGSRNGVLFLIEQDGSGVLFHRTTNSKGRLRVDDAANLLKEGGIRELKRVGIR